MKLTIIQNYAEPPMKLKRISFAAVTAHGRIYVMGGYVDVCHSDLPDRGFDPVRVSSVESYDPVDGR